MWTTHTFADSSDLRIDNARIRGLIPGQDKTAAYFEITNSGTQAILLVGVETELARAAEFHTTVRDGDMLRMRRLEQVPVPAGASVSFEPGGNHLMLFGVRSLLDQNRITFLTDNGETISASFELVAPGAVQ